MMSQPRRIHALPLHLANQIAAGEVIERPASVVKELIENSIDAAATQIDIVIEGAGIQLIQIQDNGVGIHADDLALALSRHATSKINNSDQLSAIASLGFRGEALPSIASVAKLTLTSRQQGSEYGFQIDGNNLIKQPAPHPVGSTFEIRDLFFNLPARRRFLKSNKTEQHHIMAVIHRLALSRFDIAFNIKSGQSFALRLPAATSSQQQQQRVAKLCGRSFLDRSTYFEQQFENTELKGWIGNLDAHRAQTDVQYFFINGRVIRDRVINHAIRQAYGELIPANRQAAFVLYLTIPLDMVDINVHPTKHEVRFRNARLIHGLINKAIDETLQTDTASPPTIENTVAEAQVDYRSPPSNTPATKIQETKQVQFSPSTTSAVEGKLTLIESGYALYQTHHQNYLVDLTRAVQELKSMQFEQAISSNNLTLRPILVPLRLSLSENEQQTVKTNLKLLSSLGFSITEQQQALVVNAIPALLTHADITDLLQTMIETLLNKKASKPELILTIKSYIKALPPVQIDDGIKIIEQLIQQNRLNNYAILLDKQALTRLFS